MSDYGAVELREADGGKLVLRGYASVAERWYPVGGLFEEKMNRGTWRRSLSEGPDTVLLADHNGLAFARTKNPNGGEPSLLLTEDSRGLHAEAFLDATAPRVQDLRSTAENSGLQMSVGFRCSADKWNEDRSRREVKEASTHRGDVTVCNFGANEASTATISARGEAGARERRAYAESLKGSTEHRMCPVEGFELRETPSMAVATRRRVGPSWEVMRGRSYLELARAQAAKGRVTSRRAGVPTKQVHERPSGKAKYTDAEIQKLGEEGRAHKKLKGAGYHFPIKDPEDVSHAVIALGRADPAERASIRRYIILRAIELKVTRRLPDSWTQNPRPVKGDPNVNTPAAGGPSE